METAHEFPTQRAAWDFVERAEREGRAVGRPALSSSSLVTVTERHAGTLAERLAERRAARAAWEAAGRPMDPGVGAGPVPPTLERCRAADKAIEVWVYGRLCGGLDTETAHLFGGPAKPSRARRASVEAELVEAGMTRPEAEEAVESCLHVRFGGRGELRWADR